MLAADLLRRDPTLATQDLSALVQRIIEGVIILRACEDRGLEPPGQLRSVCSAPDPYGRLMKLLRQTDARYTGGRAHFAPLPRTTWNAAPRGAEARSLKRVLAAAAGTADRRAVTPLPAGLLGLVYEQSIGTGLAIDADCRVVVRQKRSTRKSAGRYYTPPRLVQHVIRHALDPLPGGRPTTLRIVDPACGAGAFLLAAYESLLNRWLRWYTADGPHARAARPDPPIHRTTLPTGSDSTAAWCLTLRERARILIDSIFGVDLDPRAVETTRLVLLLKLFDGGNPSDMGPRATELQWPGLTDNIKCGDALVGPDFVSERPANKAVRTFDWHAEFPAVFGRENPGFDAVIGNPPWGQKETRTNQRLSAYLRARFPSTKGIFDLFRPFVEQAVHLCRPGGTIGQVLPDIVLLKNYEPTRRYLLDNLTFNAIDWWGMAFPNATIDAASIVGIKRAASPDHRVRVEVHDPRKPLLHWIPQSDFSRNERCTFNLLLTTEKRRVLERLAAFPRLGDSFEVHEGVHSGNIRAELFVDRPVDDSCRELLFGRDELTPYRLRWRGRYIRLGAAPARRTRTRYAHIGRPEWFEGDKLLVRRTGDRVLAAIDRQRRYVSNNFFIVFPRFPCGLNLDGLCALLNSGFITWLFRAIEPRQGRAFAELKIKHLAAFPLPNQQRDGETCHVLNELGRQRAALAHRGGNTAGRDVVDRPDRAGAELDAQVERAVGQVFGVKALLEPGRAPSANPTRPHTPRLAGHAAVHAQESPQRTEAP